MKMSDFEELSNQELIDTIVMAANELGHRATQAENKCEGLKQLVKELEDKVRAAPTMESVVAQLVEGLKRPTSPG